jgi:hypothetical protein
MVEINHNFEKKKMYLLKEDKMFDNYKIELFNKSINVNPVLLSQSIVFKKKMIGLWDEKRIKFDEDDEKNFENYDNFIKFYVLLKNGSLN